MNTIDPTDDPIEQDLIRDTIEQDDYMAAWASDDPTNKSIVKDDYMDEWESDDPQPTDGTKAEYERLNAETETEYSQRLPTRQEWRQRPRPRQTRCRRPRWRRCQKIQSQ